jgi:diketogulonate reductase-like aldo/keto reductase
MLDLNLLTTNKMLGMGCSTFGGSNSQITADRALRHAYDRGVVYFDLARSYGYGAAEGIVGRFATDKRSHLFIASKFGIMPPASFPLRSTLLAGARLVRKLLPSAKNAIRSASGQTLINSAFSPQIAEESLNKSLRELRTDYLDLFLLHETGASDMLRDDISNVLEKAKSKGKIRVWGGTFVDRQEAFKVIQQRPSLAAVQIGFGLDTDYFALTTATSSRIHIIYSVLSYAHCLSEKQATAVLTQVRQALPRLQFLCSLQEVLLLLAFQSLPHGVLLLSMSAPTRIDRNLAICQLQLSDDELASLLALVTQQFAGVA